MDVGVTLPCGCTTVSERSGDRTIPDRLLYVHVCSGHIQALMEYVGARTLTQLLQKLQPPCECALPCECPE